MKQSGIEVESTVENEHVIEAWRLSKDFGRTKAVRSVSLAIGYGEIFGFFGPNGAGKTTTIRLLCGLTAPTSGSAVVCGHDIGREPTRVRRDLGILPEEVNYYEKMTALKYLKFFAKMAGYSGRSARDRISHVMDISEISGFAKKPISKLSHGQRQKISVARTLLSDVPVMFLDEPFSGIDIIHRKALREYLRDYVSAGNTVFFTSHNLIEAEYIVDRFAFIDAGEILTVGAARELKDRYLLPSYAVRVSNPKKAKRVLERRLRTKDCRIKGDELLITLGSRKDVPRISVILGRAGISLIEMRQVGTMEEVFLSMRKQRRERNG